MVKHKRRNRLNLSNEQLVQLKISIDDLINDAQRYDQGNFNAIKRSSVTLRTLFYDTHTQKSLVGQMGTLDIIPFLSFSEISSQSGFQSSSIFNATFQSISASPTNYIDTWLFYPGKNFTPSRLKFKHWWHQPLLITGTDTMERKDIVTIVANQDGGAHFDSELDQKYQNIKDGSTGIKVKAGSLTGYLTTGHIASEPTWVTYQDMQLSLLREIVHETILSLIEWYKLDLPYNPDFDYNWHRKLNKLGINVSVH